jgi:hypothetical protein
MIWRRLIEMFYGPGRYPYFWRRLRLEIRKYQGLKELRVMRRGFGIGIIFIDKKAFLCYNFPLLLAF